MAQELGRVPARAVGNRLTPMCGNAETAWPAVLHPPGYPLELAEPLSLPSPNLLCITGAATAKGKGLWSHHALAQVRTALVM